MAEAHVAVAFTFTVSSEGLFFNINKQALEAVVKSGLWALKKRIARFKNSFYNQVYPFHPSSWFYFAFGVFAATYLGFDLKNSPVPYIEYGIQKYLGITHYHHVPACLLFSLVLWFSGSMLNQLILRILLSYTGWMYKPRGQKNFLVWLWVKLVKLAGGSHSRLYGYQYSLPGLPLPSLQDTLRRYLLSVQHLTPEKEYEELVRQSEAFRKGPGPKLQLFLWLKTWLTSNYVTDWWEDYVYLANREPLMANSNFYCIQTHSMQFECQLAQASRAALFTYLMLEVRRQLSREETSPIFVNGVVPLCSWQYERLFNTTRIPQLQKDKIMHWSDSNHLVVYHRGRYFRCPLAVHGQSLSAIELEQMFNLILEDTSEPAPGEEQLAALTAGPRDSWAMARANYFSSDVNRVSLETIDKGAFFISLDHEDRHIELDSPKDLTYQGRSLLLGNCYNRWFDKSFTFVFYPNGMCGFNAEHSWADAPIMAHLFELSCIREWANQRNKVPGLHYTALGRCDGSPRLTIQPSRLRWDISPTCQEVIRASLAVARSLADSIDLYVSRFTDYGRGYMKAVGFSPDAFVQMALQLGYMKDRGELALTYESSMTRLFREGRTETVRSCTTEASEFVKAVFDPTTSSEEQKDKFRKATDIHQTLTRNAMAGKGVDRHLFALYIVSKFLKLDNPFLKKILSEPWRLSTSQTPTNQTNDMCIPKDHPDAHRVTGGGFGPVDKSGYGVSYIFSYENAMCFHVSAKVDCPETSSERFCGNIFWAMQTLRDLFGEPKPKKTSKAKSE